MERATKQRRQLTGKQAVAIAMARAQTTQHELIPKDLWRPILIETEITSVLNLSTVRPVSLLMYDDTFWREKFLRDFSDLVDIVGGELPNWIIPGDMEAPEKFRDLPWRRYYNTIRFFFKKIIERLIEISTIDQNEWARVYDTGFHPFMIDAKLSEHTIYSVDVTLFERTTNPKSHWRWEKGEVVAKDTYSIWEFCRDFLLTYFPETNGDELNQFFKPLETVNIIRVWLRMELYLSSYASDATEFISSTWIIAFLHWVTDAKPISDMFWISDLSDWHSYRYQNIVDWMNDKTRPYYGGTPKTVEERMSDSLRYLNRIFDRFLSNNFSQDDYRYLTTKGKTGFQKNGVLYLGNSCVVCSTPANFVCGNCKQISYCGDECAKKNWTSNHQKECKK